MYKFFLIILFSSLFSHFLKFLMETKRVYLATCDQEKFIHVDVKADRLEIIREDGINAGHKACTLVFDHLIFFSIFSFFEVSHGDQAGLSSYVLWFHCPIYEKIEKKIRWSRKIYTCRCEGRSIRNHTRRRDQRSIFSFFEVSHGDQAGLSSYVLWFHCPISSPWSDAGPPAGPWETSKNEKIEKKIRWSRKIYTCRCEGRSIRNHNF
jgi:hypothetical protein